MTNAIYDFLANRLLNATFNWVTSDLELVAWAGAPVFETADQTIAEFKTHGATELGRSQPVLARTVSVEGVARSGPVVIPAVPVGPQITHFTLCLKNVVPDNGNMLIFMDDVLGLPFDPNGLDVVVQPDWLLNRGWFRP